MTLSFDRACCCRVPVFRRADDSYCHVFNEVPFYRDLMTALEIQQTVAGGLLSEPLDVDGFVNSVSRKSSVQKVDVAVRLVLACETNRSLNDVKVIDEGVKLSTTHFGLHQDVVDVSPEVLVCIQFDILLEVVVHEDVRDQR